MRSVLAKFLSMRTGDLSIIRSYVVCIIKPPGMSGTIQKYASNYLNPYPTAFPYGNGMVLHFYQQQESSTTKTAHKVINKGLKTYV